MSRFFASTSTGCRTPNPGSGLALTDRLMNPPDSE
jgi:hypothetical protein